MWSLALCVAPSTLFVHMVTPSLSVCMGVISLSLSMSVCGVSALFVVSGVGVYQYEPPVCVCVLIWVF